MQIHELVGAVHDAAWLPWAVQYFFLIGMSTTALFMTLPAFVLGRSSCLPHARLALITAVTTGISGPLALLADLHQPSRFWEFFVYTHKTSWMAWGSWIVMCYVTLLVLYTWAVNRPALYRWGQDDWRFAWLFRFLAFGSPENGFVRLIGVATGVAALGILTYTGMEVSIVYSRPLWHTPLLPFQFAATGAVGALGVMLVLGRLLSTGSKVEARMNKMLAVCLAVVALLGRGLVCGCPFRHQPKPHGSFGIGCRVSCLAAHCHLGYCGDYHPLYHRASCACPLRLDYRLDRHSCGLDVPLDRLHGGASCAKKSGPVFMTL